MAGGHRRRRRAGAAASLAVGALTALVVLTAAPACSTTGLIFHDSGTLKVDTPRNNQKVTQPVTVRWHLKPGTTPPAIFAVFLDRTPPRPGQPLPKPGDRTGITLTHATSVTLSDIQPTDAVSDADKNRHDVTVILLDANGRRTSEVAGFVQFQVVRR